MLLLKDECSLCGRVVHHSLLRRCYQCRKLYCINCTIFTKDGNIICLNCARRIVSPRKLGTKYSPLSRYLARRTRFTDRVTLTFAEIEGVIGDNLPFGALRNREWWTNTHSTSQGQAWLNVGWRVQEVNMPNRTVTFLRTASPRIETGRKRGEAKTSTFRKKPLIPKSAKPKRLRIPSKSRIAKAQARLRNVQREKFSMSQYRGKFKPRPAYEKRLYKPEAKPTVQDS